MAEGKLLNCNSKTPCMKTVRASTQYNNAKETLLI